MTIDEKQFAQWIADVSRTREASWNSDAKRYALSISKATKLVVPEPWSDVVAMLLFNCWNDANDWSQEVTNVR